MKHRKNRAKKPPNKCIICACVLPWHLPCRSLQLVESLSTDEIQRKKRKKETTKWVYGLCMCAGLQWWSRAVCTGRGVWLHHRRLYTKIQPSGDELPDLFPTPELLTFRKRTPEQIQSLCWLFRKEVLNRYKVYVDFLEEKFWTDTKFEAFSNTKAMEIQLLSSFV